MTDEAHRPTEGGQQHPGQPAGQPGHPAHTEAVEVKTVPEQTKVKTLSEAEAED